MWVLFLFKQRTAYELRISDWSSDVCSSDLRRQAPVLLAADQPHGAAGGLRAAVPATLLGARAVRHPSRGGAGALPVQHTAGGVDSRRLHLRRAEGDRRVRLPRRLLLPALRSEEHTSELQSPMRISYAVF